MSKLYLKLISILLIIAVSFLYVHQVRAGGIITAIVVAVSAAISAVSVATVAAVTVMTTLVAASFDCHTSPFTGFSCGHGTDYIISGSTGLGCVYEETFTFYNPQMNYGYVEQIPYTLYQDSDCTIVDPAGSYYIEQTSDDKFGVWKSCAPAPARYTDAECTNEATNGFYAMKPTDKFGSEACVRDTISAVSSNANNDASKDVAIYRFTLPGDRSSSQMTDWFFGLGYSVGSGFLSMSDLVTTIYNIEWIHTNLGGYWGVGAGSQSEVIATVPYSELCFGNVCRFTDTTIPEDSYIVYAAKILGDFKSAKGKSAGDPGYDPKGAIVPELTVLPNKFLNAGGASPTRFPPTFTEGRARKSPIGQRIMSEYDANPSAKVYLGPYKTDPCPATSTLAVDLSTSPSFTFPDPIVLNWTSSNASSCAATAGDWSGDKAPEGQEEISKPVGQYSFTITCNNAEGSASDTATTTVVDAFGEDGVQQPNCDFIADPTSIVPPQSSILWWDCVYANYCEIDQGIGSVDISSSIEVSPTQTTTYTLLCDGEGGSASFPATVIVGFTSWLKEILPK